MSNDFGGIDGFGSFSGKFKVRKRGARMSKFDKERYEQMEAEAEMREEQSRVQEEASWADSFKDGLTEATSTDQVCPEIIDTNGKESLEKKMKEIRKREREQKKIEEENKTACEKFME